MTYLYHYVLTRNIRAMEAQGWELTHEKKCGGFCNTRQTKLILRLGGDEWKTVLMRKRDD